MTLGHEVAGVVEQTGTSGGRFRAGDRVGVHYLATCGTCRYCTSGAERSLSEQEAVQAGLWEKARDFAEKGSEISVKG